DYLHRWTQRLRQIEHRRRYFLGLVALLAQHPGNSVDDVRFAATVGSNDAGNPASAEGDLRLLAERLKAHQFDFAQPEQVCPSYFFAQPLRPRAAATGQGRDQFRFLGWSGSSTKTLVGRSVVAQPPGAWMAVT